MVLLRVLWLILGLDRFQAWGLYTVASPEATLACIFLKISCYCAVPQYQLPLCRSRQPPAQHPTPRPCWTPHPSRLPLRPPPLAQGPQLRSTLLALAPRTGGPPEAARPRPTGPPSTAWTPPPARPCSQAQGLVQLPMHPLEHQPGQLLMPMAAQLGAHSSK